MRIALAQLNPIVGDVAGNTALVLQAIERARMERAELLVASELVLIGYPPRDLLLREGVVEACEQAVRRIAQAAGDLYVIVGHPRRCEGGVRPLRNSASVCHRGEIVAVCDKQLLPGYDVFDEDRYFEPGARSLVCDVAGRRTGVLICEDLWRAKDVNVDRRYMIEPVAEVAALGCELLITLHGSPFVLGKWRRHVQQLQEIALDVRVPVIAVNQVGANDDLIFDGRSLVIGADGGIRDVLAGFETELRIIDLWPGEARGSTSPGARTSEAIEPWSDPQRETFCALSLAISDYVRKTVHADVLIGLSGGIDSALTAVLASTALGPGHVHGVMMPSRYSSPGSIDDSRELARRLKLASCMEAPIKSVHEAMQATLSSPLGSIPCDVVDENVQARLRGMILMAVSNSRGALVLSTSNKSEIATGYSTLYGDMCGALAPLGDLLKTRIYELAKWINANHAACGFAQPPIPRSSIDKPPSAELRANQTDQDTLPPYDLLDRILERFIEREQSPQTIVRETGMEEALVTRWATTIDRVQYKRDQAPVIPKVTPRAFGRGRPMPIVGAAGDLRHEGMRRDSDAPASVQASSLQASSREPSAAPGQPKVEKLADGSQRPDRAARPVPSKR